MIYIKREQEEDIEHLLKRYKNKMYEEGIVDEIRKRQYYTAPSLKKRIKSKKAKKYREVNSKYIDRGYDY